MMEYSVNDKTIALVNINVEITDYNEEDDADYDPVTESEVSDNISDTSSSDSSATEPDTSESIDQNVTESSEDVSTVKRCIVCRSVKSEDPMVISLFLKKN